VHLVRLVRRIYHDSRSPERQITPPYVARLRIFGPTQKANGEWRLKTNEEFEEAINNENVVRYIKYKRLGWLGHVERMTNERVAKTIYKWKPYATRPKGRPRVRWEDDVRNGLRKMGVNNWKQTTQERKKWKEIIEQAKTHKGL